MKPEDNPYRAGLEAALRGLETWKGTETLLAEVLWGHTDPSIMAVMNQPRTFTGIEAADFAIEIVKAILAVKASTLIRVDGTFACPICSAGTMVEHDVGYDECDHCNFFAIYWDGSDMRAWAPEMVEIEYKKAAETYKVCDAMNVKLPRPRP